MRLAIFDLDGTLVDSNAIDWACFLDAFEHAFGLSARATDWSDYSHHTDRGLTREFLRRVLDRDPEEEAIARHRSVFLSLLNARMNAVEEIRGARNLIHFLRERQWDVAIATGGWSQSARLKLERAGFGHDLPMSCCDAAETREEILLRALGDRPAKDTVVFGDGPWDVRAARNLMLPFIGVGKTHDLRRAGASTVIDDFSDAEAVHRCLECATVPE